MCERCLLRTPPKSTRRVLQKKMQSCHCKSSVCPNKPIVFQSSLAKEDQKRRHAASFQDQEITSMHSTKVGLGSEESHDPQSRQMTHLLSVHEKVGKDRYPDKSETESRDYPSRTMQQWYILPDPGNSYYKTRSFPSGTESLSHCPLSRIDYDIRNRALST
jgi:hypothetical protein